MCIHRGAAAEAQHAALRSWKRLRVQILSKSQLSTNLTGFNKYTVFKSQLGTNIGRLKNLLC